jgi:hypothetical protein
MNKTFYIITIHNKQDLIETVLQGIEKCHNTDNTLPPTIICVLDGCTDNTEKIVIDFKNTFKYKDSFYILYENDVHEILSLNTALSFIQNSLDPKPDDLVIMLQDDIVLDELDINKKINFLFSNVDNLGYVSMRLGMSLALVDNRLAEHSLVESEFGHWNQMNLTFQQNLIHYNFMFTEAAVRSPAFIKWDRLEKFGFFDENLAPYGFDCHDMSLRMREAGYINGVYALKFISDVSWGSMRLADPSDYTKRINQIHDKNLKYLADKHKNYFIKQSFHDHFIKYRNNKHSQNGEDGIIAKLISILPDSNKISVEFGGGDGKTNSNTLSLLKEKDFTGYFIEADNNHFELLKQTAKEYVNIIPIHAEVDYKNTENSLTNLLRNAGLQQRSPDIMSIDIDGLDYKVWESLTYYTPKIIVIEINSSLPFNHIMNKEELSEKNLILRGTNFQTMVELGKRKGYSFVVCTGNCIFIRNDYVQYLIQDIT